MWLFTRYGFYSVACGQRSNGAIDPDPMMSRARSMEHLQNLKDRFPVLAKSEILTLPAQDYRWRLIVPKKVWTGLVAELAQEQEWSNFKNEVVRHQGESGADYAHSLHQVWDVMHRFQGESGGEAGQEAFAMTGIFHGCPSRLLKPAPPEET